MGQYSNSPQVLKKFPYPSQTRLLNLNSVPLGAGWDGYSKKPAPLPSLGTRTSSFGVLIFFKIPYKLFYFLPKFDSIGLYLFWGDKFRKVVMKFKIGIMNLWNLSLVKTRFDSLLTLLTYIMQYKFYP